MHQVMLDSTGVRGGIVAFNDNVNYNGLGSLYGGDDDSEPQVTTRRAASMIIAIEDTGHTKLSRLSRFWCSRVHAKDGCDKI